MPKLPSPDRIHAVLTEARRLLDLEPEGGGGVAEILVRLQDQGYSDPVALVRDLALAAKESEAGSEACKMLEGAYAMRRRRHDSNEERMRNECLRVMEALPELFPNHRLRDPLVTVSIRDPRPGVVITDEAKLADHLVRITRVPDKARIAEAIRDGEVVEGAELRNGPPSLEIRT